MTHPAARPLFTEDSLEAKVRDLVFKGIEFGADRIAAEDQPYWRSMAATGTRPWLDTGDMDEAAEFWCSSFAALTTNNSLLNKEVQKGIYDDLIAEAAKITGDLSEREQILEIAFILNAHHGLRLASRFGGRVSVELHTDCANDIDLSVRYGRRFFAICPEHFIVKVPLSPAGLIATRQLRADGIPVNFTLGFSARQNHIAAAFAAPSYVNIFLGRLNAYVSNNELGDGENIGERVTLASQAAVAEISKGRQVATLQIAASIRNGEQIADLAGVDVHTMPPKAAKDAFAQKAKLSCQRDANPDCVITAAEDLLSKLWDISDDVRACATALEQAAPNTVDAFMKICSAHNLNGLFPAFSESDLKTLAEDGKIPVHAHWEHRLNDGSVSIDALCTQAALLAFTKDQDALDQRIVENLK